MDLEGYLEDLGVCDILHILSLSKKTGTLQLKNWRDEGSISFAEGQVIRATSSSFKEGLGQLLSCQGIVTEEQITSALNFQKNLKEHQPLGQILVELFGVPSELIERAVQFQIEKIVFSFFSWKEGSFSFRIEELSSFGSAQVNPLDFMLMKGLSPQRLAIKGQKISDQGSTGVDEHQIDRELLELKHRRQQQGIDLLRGMLAELEHPEFCGGIILLILRYASEIMERAIIFDVRGDNLVGLGQFGLKNMNVSADELVRKMRIAVDKGSLFERVLAEKKALRGPLGKSKSESFLQAFLGDVAPEVFVAPLINDGEVVALLYGDSLLAGRVDLSLEAFEVFLAQAGLALEQELFVDR